MAPSERVARWRGAALDCCCSWAGEAVAWRAPWGCAGDPLSLSESEDYGSHTNGLRAHADSRMRDMPSKLSQSCFRAARGTSATCAMAMPRSRQLLLLRRRRRLRPSTLFTRIPSPSMLAQCSSCAITRGVVTRSAPRQPYAAASTTVSAGRRSARAQADTHRGRVSAPAMPHTLRPSLSATRTACGCAIRMS